MSKALEEFLALRQASAFAIQRCRDLEGDRRPGFEQVKASHNVFRPSAEARQTGAGGRTPGTSINDRDLDAYFVELLAAHPGAKHVNDPQGLAHYLARGITHRYGDPKNFTWESQTPFHGGTETSLWVARCPAGHVTDEVIESHQVLGWACKDCQRVYDATECRMVPRGALGTGREHKANENEGAW